MPRAVRKTSLETRTARLANKVRHAPYFVKIAKGLHLGYYRGAAVGPGSLGAIARGLTKPMCLA